MKGYFYWLSESSPNHRLFTVGYEDMSGTKHTDSDWNDREDAANRTAWLNGNSNAKNPMDK